MNQAKRAYIPSMRTRNFTSGAGALLVFAVSFAEAKAGHGHLSPIHQKLHVHRDAHAHAPATRSIAEERHVPLDVRFYGQSKVMKRDGDCPFPKDAGLVPVTPDQQNGGWAMSPDQPCTRGKYCPYACPSGQVSMQWDPSATSYSYPQSMVRGPLGQEVHRVP